MDYQKAYLILFNAITTAIRTAERPQPSMRITDSVTCLRKAQQETEALYIEEDIEIITYAGAAT